MKPRKHHLAKLLLPPFIVIPAMTMIASAATISPDGFGNVTVVNPADSGPNNIVTGNNPPAGSRQIYVGPGITLNPTGVDVIEVQTADASNAIYTITNDGTLISDGGPSNYGISTIDLVGFQPSITVINNGSISGAGAIRANNQLTLTNNGTLTGTSGVDAAVFTKNGGTVTNNIGGVITGSVSGIRSENAAGTLTVTNNGSITGTNFQGIDTAGTLILTNNYDVATATAGTIFGGASGVIAGANSQITNFGTITGNGLGAGVQVGATSTITNKTSSDINGAVFGGQITGSIAGIAATNGLTFTNENLGSVTGGGIGIVALDNATITNNLGASITGNLDDGIDVGNTATIINTGTITGSGGKGIDAGNTANITNNLGASITGSGDSGIEVGSTATITNNGTVTGSDGDGVSSLGGLNLTNNGSLTGSEDGIDIDGNGAASIIINTGSIIGQGDDAIDGDDSVQTITNSNIITGTNTALSLEGGNDVVNLNDGSVVTGAIDGGLGADSINFSGGLTAATDITNNIVRGNVSVETVNKTGGGVAFIGGVGDAFTSSIDTVTITGGGLYFNSDITGLSVAQTTINAGGTALGGTGTWNANINITAGGVSAGAIPINLDVNPENAVGTFTVTGDVTHSPGSFIRVDVIPETTINNGVNSDLIVQTGVGNVYNLGGAGLRISATDTNSVISNGTYTVVDSNEVIQGSISGVGVQFNANVTDTGPFIGTESGTNNTNTVLTNFFLTTGFEDGGTNLVFTIDHNYANLPGLTQNQAALGGALDAAVGNGNALVQDFIAALDYSNLGAVQATLASLNPEGYLSAASSIVNSNYRLNRIAQDHLAQIRSSGNTVKINVGSQTDSKGAVVPAETTSSPGSRGSFWGSVSYDWQDYEGNGPDSDFDGETAAITAGFDYRVAPALVLGVMIDGSTSDFDSDSGGTDIDSLRFLAYGTWGESTGLYSDFLVGYGTHDLDLHRSLGGILFGSNSTSTDANSLQALWTVGYAFGDNTLKHGPFAGLEYQKVEVDGFTESGTLPISVDDYDVDSLRALLGYRVNGNYGRFTPYASIAYAHEFEDGSNSADASIGGAGFTVRGAEQGSAVILTAGTGISLTDSLTLDLGYRGEISVEDQGLDSHGATLGLQYSF